MEGHSEVASDQVMTETGRRMQQKNQNQYSTLEVSFYAGLALGVVAALALMATWYFENIAH